MAAFHSAILLAATLFVFATSISATKYIVGDESGWTLDYDYQSWAKDKIFYVGDTLVFNYASGSHNVVKVDGTGFKECTTASSNGTLTSGRDVIALKTAGKKWYVCGVAKHCELRNMKLVITVMSPVQNPYASSTLAAVPTIYGFVAALFGGLLLLFA